MFTLVYLLRLSYALMLSCYISRPLFM